MLTWAKFANSARNQPAAGARALARSASEPYGQVFAMRDWAQSADLSYGQVSLTDECATLKNRVCFSKPRRLSTFTE